jgi:phosphatidate phosphatase APP1
VLKKVIAGVVILAAVAAGVVGYHSYTNRDIYAKELAETQELGLKPTSSAETEDGQSELVAVVDSQLEADEISRLYGIKLKSYSYGVAVYTTDKDPAEVIRMGEEEGYPTLEINQTYYLDKEN